MKKRVVVTTEIDIEIPDDKIEETLKDYRNIISPQADIKDIFEQIAYTECVLGGGFCEGVGERNTAYYSDIVYTDTEVEYNEKFE